MTAENQPEDETKPGGRTYRAWVGNPAKYDVMAAMQFSMLTAIGLRQDHALLDVGCGSLRGGRLFIPYLKPDRYFGIEPESWLVEEGIEKELGRDQVRIKRPTFSDVADFRLTVFGRRFDFILAQSIFSHASAEMIARCLSEARLVLEPDGILAATYLPGEEDYAGGAWVYPECIAYRPATFASLVHDAGLAARPFDWPHPSGQRWVLITHPGSRIEFERLSLARVVEDRVAARRTLDRIGRSAPYRLYRRLRPGTDRRR